MTAKSDYYRVKVAVNLPYRGEYVLLDAGELVSKDSPLLKAIGPAAVAEHFEEVKSFGRWDVEEATAAPGEKRGSRAAPKADVEEATAEKRGASAEKKA